VARIALLSPDVADQIAAGEVVERPASVVKELVENALDAGATVVTVTIDGGGLTRIAVTDDGAGMTADDLGLAVIRHATSKIRVAADLVGVATFGFRGEAIPSIGSVSRMRIATRQPSTDEGAEIVIIAGVPGDVKPAGLPVGTTVQVDELFYNVPARRKFLRSGATESAACVEAVVRLALPRPDVRFVIRRDGKTARELLRHDDIGARARDLWPDETLAEIHGARGPVRLRAWLGPPERARAGGTSLAIYVNGRHVRDRVLLRAVAQAYGSMLEGGRYPVGALLVDVTPGDVDVNVHPQKAEVRFAPHSSVFESVMSVVRDGLSSAPWARAGLSGAPGGAANRDPWAGRWTGGPAAAAMAHAGDGATASLFDRPRTVPPTPAAERAAAPGSHVAPVAEPDPWGLAPRPAYPPATYPQGGDASATPTDAGPSTPHSAATRVADNASTRDVRTSVGGAFGSLHYVGQMRRMFLVCEGSDGMVLLDQHAAAERVTFERLRRSFASRSVAMQPLLVPEVVDVGAEGVALVEERGSALLRAGMELTPAGPSTVTVRGVPAILLRVDPRRLARDVLAEVGRQASDFSRAVDLVLATMACHGSIRGGDEVGSAEAQALLAALDDVDFAGHCPHGRPVVWTVRWGELERRLGR